jgi:hypothetical protein
MTALLEIAGVAVASPPMTARLERAGTEAASPRVKPPRTQEQP